MATIEQRIENLEMKLGALDDLFDAITVRFIRPGDLACVSEIRMERGKAPVETMFPDDLHGEGEKMGRSARELSKSVNDLLREQREGLKRV